MVTLSLIYYAHHTHYITFFVAFIHPTCISATLTLYTN